MSSRDKLEVWLPRTGPYPSWGAAGPVGGGSRGAREGSADFCPLSGTSGGKGLTHYGKVPHPVARQHFDETHLPFMEAKASLDER